MNEELPEGIGFRYITGIEALEESGFVRQDAGLFARRGRIPNKIGDGVYVIGQKMGLYSCGYAEMEEGGRIHLEACDTVFAGIRRCLEWEGAHFPPSTEITPPASDQADQIL